MIVVASSKVDSDVVIVMVVFRSTHAEATFMMVWFGIGLFHCRKNVAQKLLWLVRWFVVLSIGAFKRRI
jgi:hypothetical protein